LARDRQEAKRRQAERREARLRERGRADAGDEAGDGAATSRPERTDGSGREGDERTDATDGRPTDSDGVGGSDDVVLDPAAEARLATAAPPEDTGRSDTVVESPPPAPHFEEDEPEERDASDRPRRQDGGEKERGRVMAFLVAVWAELQRVQWPDRKTLTTLTGVVLGFVLIAGGYLGALDAIFSRLVQTIL
jgi:preprotein translocase subunit SecE